MLEPAESGFLVSRVRSQLVEEHHVLSDQRTEHPYPQRKRSDRLRWPRYVPDHSDPFIASEDMNAEDWRQVYKFMAARRQLAIVELKPSLREKLTARMPSVIAYLDARRIDPYYPNRPHTVGFGRKRKSPPEPSTVPPATALSDLERALSASIERSR